MIQLIGLLVAIVANLLCEPAVHGHGIPAGISGGGPVGRPQPIPQPVCEPPPRVRHP